MKHLKRGAIVALATMLAAMPALAADAVVPKVDTGNTAWLLLCSALVMLMTPGLAFFYGGMVHRKNVVSTLLQNYVALAIVGIFWVIAGYSLVFTEGSPILGGQTAFMLKGLGDTLYTPESGIPSLAFVAFQMMFAIITPALITGAFAERVNFKAWLLIMLLWSLLVYVPVAHWVWGPGGWILAKGGLDFAGGLVVHMTAGFSALACAFLFGRRGGGVSTPNDVPMIMLGAGLLWFGWFGFNAGSAITSGALASYAFMNTFLGASSAFLVWMALDWMVHGKPTAVGSSIGLVVGLVAITPAAGFVSIQNAMVIGAVAAIISFFAAKWVKKITHLDDSLDVFACHGMGGLTGAVLTGLLAETAVNSSVTVQGLLISGEKGLFIANVTAAVVVAVFSFIMTMAIVKVVNIFVPIRVGTDAEGHGLDTSMHGEFARVNEPRK